MEHENRIFSKIFNNYAAFQIKEVVLTFNNIIVPLVIIIYGYLLPQL